MFYNGIDERGRQLAVMESNLPTASLIYNERSSGEF